MLKRLLKLWSHDDSNEPFLSSSRMAGNGHDFHPWADATLAVVP